MTPLPFRRSALALSAAAFLAGCGGSQPPIGAPPVQVATKSVRESQAIKRDSATGSWMLPEAKNEDLLYITNYSYVSVLTYPEGKQVGTLNGFSSAAGECVDAKGDVFVTNDNPVALYEYAHGSTKRIATYLPEKAGSTGCAIDPATNNIAVTGSTNFVNIFEPGKRKPNVIEDEDEFANDLCTYDNRGDLFVGGSSNATGGLALTELPNGTRKFTDIQIGPSIDPTQNIQWVGKNLVMVSFTGKPEHKNIALVQLAINGSQATQVGTTALKRPAYIILQYFITNGTVIVPNWYLHQGQHDEVLYYHYPKGGEPFKRITKKMTDPRGVAVSYASE
jgi:hypothetical protein